MSCSSHASASVRPRPTWRSSRLLAVSSICIDASLRFAKSAERRDYGLRERATMTPEWDWRLPLPLMGDEAADQEVEAWFLQKGFTVSIDETDGVWWASLTAANNSDFVVPRYGSGTSPQAAAQGARERWEQEQGV